MGKGKLAALVAFIALLLFPMFSGCGKSEAPVRTVAVPTLAGMTTEEAEKILNQEGLLKGVISEEYSDTPAAGEILSTRPPEGEVVEEGSMVDLVVSKGPELIILADLVGKGESEATATLQAQGFLVNVQRAYSESAASELVLSMDPAPGAVVKKGSGVTVTVSLGSAYVTCRTCGGKGTLTSSVTCPECGGSGVCYS